MFVESEYILCRIYYVEKTDGDIWVCSCILDITILLKET